MAGLKDAVPFPLSAMPAPLNAPEGAWLPVSVTIPAFTQMEDGRPVKLTVGKAIVFTVADIVDEQPPVDVTVTV